MQNDPELTAIVRKNTANLQHMLKLGTNLHIIVHISSELIKFAAQIYLLTYEKDIHDTADDTSHNGGDSTDREGITV